MKGPLTEGTPPNGCPIASVGSALAGKTLADPLVQAHPNDYYRAMRTEDPVHYDERLGLYLVARYEDVKSVLGDPYTLFEQGGV